MITTINQSFKFCVDQTEFFCDPQLIYSQQFLVQSTPKNYSVIYDSNDAVFSIQSLSNPKSILIIDANILKIYQPTIPTHKIFSIIATENNKSLEMVTTLINFFQKNGLTKSDQVIVIGGGITQEITAFACAIYKRGIPWIYFPTTLLSMSDSCLGGKASVNYQGVKNQLGLFFTPSTIYLNPNFLATLNASEINSGLGEILKSCIIGGHAFINLYRQNVTCGKIKSISAFKTLIFSALAVKKTIIEKDEFESNHRRVLNYGHTVGHAIEALSQFNISHGEAITAGMIFANKLSYQCNFMTESDMHFLNQLCYDLLSEETISYLKAIQLDDIKEFILQDKKASNQKITFVLATSPGNFEFHAFDLVNISDLFIA